MNRESLATRWLLWIGVWTMICPANASWVNADDGPSTAAVNAKVDFSRDVAPILKQHCLDCHGPGMQLADLRLDQKQHAIIEGLERDLIKPGHSGDSLLIQRLVDKKLGLLMPPTFPFFPEDKLGLPEAQIQTLKRWIDQGADWPDGVSLANESQNQAEGPDGKALFAAIRDGNHRIVARLLDNKSLSSVRDRYGSTPVMYAALYGDLDLLKLLVERGGDVNAADHRGATALMWAAGDLAKVQWLVEHNAQVDVRSSMGRTPLLIASTYPGNAPVVQFLLKSGAKINDRDLFGETVLTSAGKRGDAALVEALIAAGADARGGGGFQGRSPLVWAADEGNLETVACLLKHGAAQDQKSLNMALFNASVRGPAAAVRLLLEHGANPNAVAGFGGYTPLMGAAYSENMDAETVKLLLQSGGDPQMKAATGDTTLQLAARRGKTEIVALLAPAIEPPASAPSVSPKAAAPVSVRDAAQRSLSLLQKCGPEFFRKSGCVACHQHSVTSLALVGARSHGLSVDEQVAREQVQITAFTVRSFRDRFLQRVDHPANSAPGTGYILLGLAAENYPPDDATDANVIEMANRQLSDGSWTAFGHRPPLEYSRTAATALAIRVMQLYGPPGLKAAFEQRITRGRDWLIPASPGSNSDHAFRLLGLAWSGARSALVQSQSSALLEQQRDDGGWSQLETLDSDAYATGLTLYALRQVGGIEPMAPAYQRGVNYLLRTQLPDGSWHVKTRSFPLQPYFESGFPHGPDQWISASATGYAAAALVAALPLVPASGK